MKYDRNSVDPSNIYTPVRGKSLPLKINKHANYPQLLTAAIIKRKAYDQSFNEKQEWDIVYPDGKIASSLPGQPDPPFCLSDYKEDLGKNYSRIILYLQYVHKIPWKIQLKTMRGSRKKHSIALVLQVALQMNVLNFNMSTWTFGKKRRVSK